MHFLWLALPGPLGFTLCLQTSCLHTHPAFTLPVNTHIHRGVEARVPFLDRNFLEVAMAIDPAEKMIDKSKGESHPFDLRAKPSN